MNTISWWSGGITSAVACKLSLDLFDDVRIIFIDTGNEDDDTERFKKDCELWYGKKIETIRNDDYDSIQDVWRKHKSLNVAHGAICSYKLKRVAREKWEKENEFSRQVFGFEAESKELKRAKSLLLNHGHTNPVFPLLMYGYDKERCIEIAKEAGIEIPRAYLFGLHNNNCLKTGCVQGGIGYWKKIQKDFPDKFEAMADMEHELTNSKGSPVTMLKDQGKNSLGHVFLIKHPKYENKCIDDMKGREVKPLVDCNGFCGTNDLLGANITETELFWDDI